MADALPIPERMDADAFLRWAERQPGRYELEDGRVVAQANEQSAHALLKFQVHRQLFEAVARAGAPCFVYPDGMNVRVDEATIYCPDGMVRCGPRLPDDALEVGDPAIVVEVVSSSSEVRDTVYKAGWLFQDSFAASLPDLAHRGADADPPRAGRGQRHPHAHRHPPGGAARPAGYRAR